MSVADLICMLLFSKLNAFYSIHTANVRKITEKREMRFRNDRVIINSNSTFKEEFRRRILQLRYNVQYNMFKYTITILYYTITRYIKTSVEIDFYSKHKKKQFVHVTRTSVILINNNVLAVIQFKRRHIIIASRTHIIIICTMY